MRPPVNSNRFHPPADNAVTLAVRAAWRRFCVIMGRMKPFIVFTLAAVAALSQDKPKPPAVDPAMPVQPKPIPAEVQARYWRAVATKLNLAMLAEKAEATAKAAEAELRAACGADIVADEGGVLVCRKP